MRTIPEPRVSFPRPPPFRPPLHERPAVNPYPLAGNIPSPSPGKKRHQLRHVVARAETAEWNRLTILRLNLIRKRRGHRGFDETGSHGIYCNRPPAQLLGHGLGETDDPGL